MTNNSEKQKKEKKKTTTIIAIVFLVLSFLIFDKGYLLFTGKMSEADKKKYTDIGITAGIIYRHSVGYNKFCSNNGYELTNYPNLFKETFKNELDSFYKKVEKNSLNYDKLIKDIDAKYNDYIEEAIKGELYALKKQLTIELLADETDISMEDIQWEDQYDEIIPFEEICMLFDENAAEIISTDGAGTFSFMKNLINKI